MANQKISQMIETSEVGSNDYIPLVQNGENKKVKYSVFTEGIPFIEAMVEDTLDSTSKTNALSANQGRILNQRSTYSTEETVVGTWLDKPIYRKVIPIGNLPNNSIKNVAHGIENLGHVTNLYLSVATGTSFYVANMTGIDVIYSSGTVVVRATLTDIQIGTTKDYSGHTGYAVIEYTKTTD